MPRKHQFRDVTLARRLRRTMTLPEVLLWRALRRQELARFRRQYPLGPYVLDFYCPTARLCVEVDGQGHNMGDRPARDAARDSWLTAEGIEVVRIPADEVLRGAEQVAEALVRKCHQ